MENCSICDNEIEIADYCSICGEEVCQDCLYEDTCGSCTREADED